MSSQFLKKDVRNDVDILHEDKHQNFLQLISTLWTSKFPISWYYHYWWAWSSIFKVLKVTSLQYLYNISKINLGMKFIFCIQINKVSTSWHYSFWRKWPDISKLPKLLLLRCKAFRYFTGVHSCFFLFVNSRTMFWFFLKLVFTSLSCYGLSVVLFWYLFVRLWVELFVSKGLIQVETTVTKKALTLRNCNKNETKNVKIE